MACRKEASTKFNFVGDVVDFWAKRYPDLPALHWVSQDLDDEKILTYDYFSKESHRAAILLHQLGLRKGDRLIVILPRVPEW